MSSHDSREPWYVALARLQADGEPHALATIVGVAGSTPREPGAKLVVTRERVFDTLGGGHFEQQIIDGVRQRLAAKDVPAATLFEAFPLGARSGQCCGGQVQVMIELFPGCEARLALFGAGHVGQALVELLAPLPWRIDWYDSRDAALQGSTTPRVTRHRLALEDTDLDRAIDEIAPNSHVLVMTHDHALDRALVERLLQHRKLRSLGLIGSFSKAASFRSRLAAAGVDAAVLSTLRCPIGLGKSRGKRPHEIAISIAAELLALDAAPQDAPARGIAAQALRERFPVNTH